MNDIERDLQSELNEAETKLIALSNNYQLTISKINDVKNYATSLSTNKAYKIIHFLYRTKQQFILGKLKDKKNYVNWLMGRSSKGKETRNQNYNPLYPIINNLDFILKNNESLSFDYALAFGNIKLNARNASKEFLNFWQKATLISNPTLTDTEIVRSSQLIEKLKNREFKGIIVFPYVVDWEPLQTPQQLLRAFAKDGYLCLFCEQPENRKMEVEVEENIILTTEKIMLKAVQNHEVIVLCTWIPMLPIINAIPNKIVWYHVLDHIELFSGYCDEYSRLHDYLLSQAEIVSYVAKELAEIYPFPKNALYLQNACNSEDFVKNIHPNFIPSDIKPYLNKGKKIIGYFGYIAQWFDMKTIYELTLNHPEWIFIFVGEKIGGFDEFNHERIIFLGRKKYQDVADYAKFFDIALIPFEISPSMDCVSPIKFFEYCALGLPVVSSQMREMEQYKGETVFLASNTKEYEEGIEKALSLNNQEKTKSIGKVISENNTWSHRVDELKPVIDEIIQTKSMKNLIKEYKNLDVLFLSVIDHDFRYQRPQHLAASFSEQGSRVFYVNANFNSEKTLVKKIIDNVQIISLKSLENTSIHNADYTQKDLDLFSDVEELISSYYIRDCVIVVEYPSWLQLALKLRDKYGFRIVTDYLDDFTGFEGTNFKGLGKIAEDLLSKSDLVVASSSFLAEKAQQFCSKVEIIRNGTEFKHFYSASLSDASLKKERKKVGYFGAIAHWFDVEKVVYAAQHCPEADFVLIGEVSVDAPLLKTLGNIKLLGEISYTKLPEYLRDFDVCLIPFDASTDLIKATNPVKFYEYLSAGKKVVATEIPELMAFRDKYVYLSNDNQQFVDYIKLCLEGKDTLKPKNELIEFAQEHEWTKRGYQFMESVKKSYPKVSVIVLTYNQLSYTKLCIQSIIENTAYPNVELILVDNNSSDDTQAYLSELGQLDPRIKVILNKDNLGFAEGNNVGIKASTGDYLILLNNDTVVTRGWLTNLVKHFAQNKKLGLLGPVTNSIANEAKIETNYNTLKQMHLFAFDYTQKNMNVLYEEVDVLAMFCLMVSREALSKIGLIDSSYGIGMFEDDDYSYKAKSFGFEIKCAEDVFIHHYGSASFNKIENSELMELFSRNQAIFEKKWNIKWKEHKFRSQKK